MRLTSYLMNKTVFLAPEGDKAMAEATPMKAVCELDLRGECKGEERDC